MRLIGLCTRGAAHAVSEWTPTPGFDRCIWCGKSFPTIPPLLLPHELAPPVTVATVSPNVAMVTEIEARFKAMARAHAANTDTLIAWQQQGNRLPAAYR